MNEWEAFEDLLDEWFDDAHQSIMRHDLDHLVERLQREGFIVVCPPLPASPQEQA